jgi:cell fate regulator YaaT (PSP1 superfamily)
MDIYDPNAVRLVEVSFKKGARKDYFHNPEYSRAITGDMVVVESSGGIDVGRISLSGDLVLLQLKKRGIPEDRVTMKVIRKANSRDLEKLEESRAKEKAALVKSRVIARTLGLDMKLGDVEYQGDGRKATFFYTAEGRVDFRELVKQYAREFKVKIEMRQIGARQESARIGGLGACGRELCCSTWLSDFKSVTTSAARYQNIAINQTKLSGQCGRLKCCLNYELDSYIDALADFPKNADRIQTHKGSASLIKTDIFKGLLYYSYNDPMIRGAIESLDKEVVKKILEMNKRGEKPEDLKSLSVVPEVKVEDIELEFADVTGEIELPSVKRRNSRNRGKRKPQQRGRKAPGDRDKTKGKADGSTEEKNKPRSRNNRNRNRKRNPNRNPNNDKNNNSDNKG